MDVIVILLQCIVSVCLGDNLFEVFCINEVFILYSCMVGCCGMCCCWVVFGNVVVIGGVDMNGFLIFGQIVLVCQIMLVEDCVIELLEIDEVVVYVVRIVKLKVVFIEDMIYDIKCIQLDFVKLFEYLFGQYVMLQFMFKYVWLYFMVVVNEGNMLEFYVCVVLDGCVILYIVSEFKVGDDVCVSGLLGMVYLCCCNVDLIFCVVGGMGFVFILFILCGMVDVCMMNLVYVYFGVCLFIDVYGMYWLDVLCECFLNLYMYVVIIILNMDCCYCLGVVIDVVVSDWLSFIGWCVYLVGVFVMVDVVSLLLCQCGVLFEYIYVDVFYVVGV